MRYRERTQVENECETHSFVTFQGPKGRYHICSRCDTTLGTDAQGQIDWPVEFIPSVRPEPTYILPNRRQRRAWQRRGQSERMA